MLIYVFIIHTYIHTHNTYIHTYIHICIHIYIIHKYIPTYIYTVIVFTYKSTDIVRVHGMCDNFIDIYKFFVNF